MKKIYVLLILTTVILSSSNAQNIRVNAGGGAVTSNSGLIFSADTYFDGGSSYVNPSVNSISETVDDEIYLTERSSGVDLGSFSYKIPVNNGTYLLRLHFAEIYFGAPGGGSGSTGNRIFDVQVEGQLVINNLDLIAVAGTTTAFIADVLATVSDDTLNMNFTASVDQPKISAFEVLTFPAGEFFAIPEAINFGDQEENHTSDPVKLKFFNGTASTVNISSVTISGADANEFSHDFPGTDSVPANESYTINVTLTPYQTGPAAAVMTIVHDAGTPNMQININGSGVEDCSWEAKSDAIQNRFVAASVATDSLLYVFGGFKGLLEVTGLLESYNPSTDTWTQLDSMPLPVTHNAAVLIDGQIWTAGGFVGDEPGPATDSVQVYDIATDTWSYGPALPELRASLGMAVVGRNIHVFGGLPANRNSNVGDHWALDVDNPGNGWVSKADMPNPRNHFGVAVVQGKIYAVGGQFNHDFNPSDTNLVHCYDPLTDMWTAVASMPENRAYIEGSVFAYNDNIYTAGGKNGSQIVGDMFKYSVTDNSWTLSCNLPQNLQGPTAKLVGNKIILTNGGINGIVNTSTATYCREVTPEYNCAIPTGLNADSTGLYTAYLSWDTDATAPIFRIRYNIKDSVGYQWATPAGSSNNKHVLSNLLLNTTYQAQIRSICPDNISGWSSIIEFTTDSFNCTIPQNLRVIETTPGTITVKWDNTSKAPAFRVKYNTTGMNDPIWVTADGSPNQTYTITGLFANTSYDIVAKSLCDGNFSDFTSPITATTDSGLTCSRPEEVVVSNITVTTARVSWNYNGTGPAYRIRYREVGTLPFTYITTAGFPLNSYTITGLKENTQYELRVKSLCPDNFSLFSTTVVFTTAPYSCTIPTGVHISGVTAGTITVAWDSSSTAPAFRVKYNRTGMTDYIWETATGTPNQSYTISGLFANTSYDIEVNSLCPGNFSAFSGAVQATTDSGYTCSRPEEVMVSNITSTTALVTWNYNGTAPKYTIRYRPVGSIGYSLAFAAGFPNTSHTITGLLADTEYEVRVRSVCDDTISLFSKIVTFTTDTFNCAVPTVLDVTDIFHWRATVVWDSLVSGPSYRVRINTTGLNDYKWLTVAGYPNRTKTVHNLTANTSYDVVVKSLCPGNFSDFSQIFTFQTPSIARLAAESELGSVYVNPNPVQDVLGIYFSNLKERTYLRVHDISGKLVFEQTLNTINSDNLILDVSAWPSGIYVLSAISGESIEKLRILKE